MYKSLEGICYFYDQLKNIPAPGITCPQEDIIIPVDIEKVKITDKHRAQRMARYDNSNTCDHKRKNLSIYFRYRSRNKLHVATHG